MSPPVVILAAGTAASTSTGNGWSGADPAQVGDGSDYELGTTYRANANITLTHVRVFSGAGPFAFPGRQGRVWVAGAVAATADMDTNLPAGWAAYALATPLPVTSGTLFIVSYSTNGNYAALPGAFTAGDVPSSDGKVSGVQSTVGHLNGLFANTPGTLPTESFGDTFYGVDVAYQYAGAGGGVVYFPIRLP